MDNPRYAATLPFERLRENLEFLAANDLDVEVMMYDTGWVRNFPRNEVKAMAELLEPEGVGVRVQG